MQKVFELIIRNKLALLFFSFLLPSIIYGLILAKFGIYPFGSKSILINDMFSQYIQFYNRLYDVFYNGKDIFFSWETGMGVNFLGVIAYYLSSPISLVILFFDRNHLPEAIVLITLIKFGLSGTAMYIFIKRFIVNGKFEILIFSTLYALTGYSVAYSFNIMWLDGIYMLPLILLGVERLLNDGRFILLLITLAITFISNFYISYMVGVFTFLYFLVRYFSIYGTKNITLFFKKMFQFSMATAIGAGLSSLLIIPTFLVLKNNLGEAVNPQDIADFHIFNLYYKFFIGSYDSLVNGLPNIYVGLLTVLLFPLFFVSKNIHIREKILFLIIMLFLVISFQSSWLNFLWHGMDNPNWFPHRFSFLLSFLALFLAFRTFYVIEHTEWSYLKGIYVFNIMYILVLSKIDKELMDNKQILINIALLTFYFLLLYCKLFIRQNKNWLYGLLLFVVCLDVTLNSMQTIRAVDNQFNYQTREAYNGSTDYKNMLNWVKKNDSTFYRIDSRTPLTWNDSMEFNYKKMESFNSLSNNVMNHYLNELGYTIMEGIFISMNKGIISTDSLLGFKYIIARDPVTKHGYELVHKEGTLLLYKNKNVLPLGFVINKENTITFPKEDNPFIKHNLLFQSNLFTGIEPASVVYENLSPVMEGSGIRVIKDDKTKSGYINLSFTVSGQQQFYSLLGIEGLSNTNIYVNETQIKTNYPNAYDNRVIELGAFKDEVVQIIVEVLTDELKINNQLFYLFDMKSFENRAKDLESQSLNIESFSDTRINGKVNSNKDGVLFLSIPYDSGWHVSVDGKKSKINNFAGFIGVDIKSGKHPIELQYVPPGFRLGSLISICSLLLFILIVLIEKKKKDKEQKN